MVASGLEVVGAFNGCEGVDETAERGPEALDRALGGFAQERPQLGNRVLIGLKSGEYGGR
jgi:hypothetical protein